MKGIQTLILLGGMIAITLGTTAKSSTDCTNLLNQVFGKDISFEDVISESKLYKANDFNTLLPQIIKKIKESNTDIYKASSEYLQKKAKHFSVEAKNAEYGANQFDVVLFGVNESNAYLSYNLTRYLNMKVIIVDQNNFTSKLQDAAKIIPAQDKLSKIKGLPLSIEEIAVDPSSITQADRQSYLNTIIALSGSQVINTKRLTSISLSDEKFKTITNNNIQKVVTPQFHMMNLEGISIWADKIIFAKRMKKELGIIESQNMKNTSISSSEFISKFNKDLKEMGLESLRNKYYNDPILIVGMGNSGKRLASFLDHKKINFQWVAHEKEIVNLYNTTDRQYEMATSSTEMFMQSSKTGSVLLKDVTDETQTKHFATIINARPKPVEEINKIITFPSEKAEGSLYSTFNYIETAEKLNLDDIKHLSDELKEIVLNSKLKENKKEISLYELKKGRELEAAIELFKSFF